MTPSTRVRVGAVSYLNTKPLVYGLRPDDARIDLTYDLPSRLAEALHEGRLDVALIPSIEVFRNPGYAIVSDACIAAHGRALSVRLLGRVPLREARSLALDEGSRTSVALARILLNERFGLEPALQPFPIGARIEDTPADAVLVIGDRAIHPPRGGFVENWDLGEEWQRCTGLPFVFAVWAARDDGVAPVVAAALSLSRDLGVANLETIAAREASAVDLTRDACLAYLRENLHFRLGPSELRGLETFYRSARRLGLVADDWRGRFAGVARGRL